MEHQKILNLLNELNDSKFVTRKWNVVNYNLRSNHDATNEITYNTGILKSNLSDYNDATQVAFKNCKPFTKSITEIHETTIDDAENLDLVTPMSNLTKYISSYSETTGSL